jgi:hypothetical protein
MILNAYPFSARVLITLKMKRRRTNQNRGNLSERLASFLYDQQQRERAQTTHPAGPGDEGFVVGQDEEVSGRRNLRKRNKNRVSTREEIQLMDEELSSDEDLWEEPVPQVFYR